MNRVKISSGLAAIVLLASLFSGWSTLLTVTVLILLFCELDEKIKSIMVRVITFYVGLTIFDLAWGLIVDGINLIPSTIEQLVTVINSYLSKPIDILKLEVYLLNPATSLVGIADGIINYLIIFAKFAFIVCILGNKAMKENFVVKKINEYVNKAVNYINSFEINANNMQQQTAYVQGQPNVQMPQQNVSMQNNGQNNNL